MLFIKGEGMVIVQRQCRIAAVIAGLCVATSLGRAEQSDAQAEAVLDLAASDADAIVVVPNLSGLSRGLAALQQAMGLPLPQMDDALAAFKRQMGMVEGLNDNGAMLLVTQDLASALTAEPPRLPSVVLIMPTENYAAFVGGLGGDGDEAVTAVTLPHGEAGFAKPVAGHAVMGRDRAMVQAYSPANAGASIVNRLGAVGGDYLGELDALVYIDIEKVGPTLIAKLEQAMGLLSAPFDQPEPAGAMEPVKVVAVLEHYGRAAKAVLEGCTALVLGLDVGEQGIGLTKVLRYKPDSALAAVIPGGEGGSAAHLTRLPDQTFIFAASLDAEAIALGALSEAVAQTLPEAEKNPTTDLRDMWLGLARQIKGIATCLYAPQRNDLMAGGGLLNSLTILKTDDGAAFATGFQKYLNQMNATADLFSSDADADQALEPTLSTSYTKNALEVEGVRVDQYQVQVEFPPESMQQMGQVAPVVMMLGATGSSGYIAVKDDYVLLTTVLDLQLVTSGLKEVVAGGGLGASGPIRQVRDTALPVHPALEMYISLSGIAQAANPIIALMGAPPITIPQEVPPIALGMVAKDNTMVGRLYVPSRAISFIVETANQVRVSYSGPGDQGAFGQPPMGR